MYEWDLAGRPAEIASHQNTEWGDMWDSSYFDMDYTNANGETERMIADGTQNFDSRHTQHLYGANYLNDFQGSTHENGSTTQQISNLGWGNAGFGGPTGGSSYAPDTGFGGDILSGFDQSLGDSYSHESWS